MDETDLVIQFAKLWGMETADARADKEKYRQMESYDSIELFELLTEWKNEYIHDENADDTVDFFYKKFNNLFNRRI